jgi:cytoskeletal protein CcmA (bactofilin family)
MWTKKKKSHAKLPANFDTLISVNAQLEGDLNFSGGLHLDGKVKGTIRADAGGEAIVRISQAGEVDGDVIAPHIIINGTVHGDVYSSKHIELASKASIKGNVYYHLIEMTMGAEVNGNLVHHKEPAVNGVLEAKATLDQDKTVPSDRIANDRSISDLHTNKTGFIESRVENKDSGNGVTAESVDTVKVK